MKKILVCFILLSFQLSAQSLVAPKPSAKPSVNGAKIFGIRSGSTFLHTLPVTGERPMEFTVTGLPSGLKLNASTGTISGRVTKKGDYSATVHVKNSKGKSDEVIRIVVGDQIALTPPMGWDGGDQLKVMDAQSIEKIKQAMLKYDLVNHGYNYLIIHDSWQGKRGGKHHGIMADSLRYPSMKKMIDAMHAAGLKAGIYSTPWVLTPGNHIGSSADSADGFVVRNPVQEKNLRVGKYSFYKQDAKQWSDWGVDLLKFEWHPLDIRHARLMSEELKKTHKDIVLSIAGKASYSEASEWQRIANTWNTLESSPMNWDTLARLSEGQEQWSPYTGPGHWAMPGKLNAGISSPDANGAVIPLNREEQMSQFTMWCLLSSPLFLQGDLSNLDEFTVSLLTNDEVIAVDQDAQGIQARKVFAKQGSEAWAKSLQDGSLALGLFNKGAEKMMISISWAELGITGARNIRNLWMQNDLGKFKDHFEIEVAPHGVVLLKISKP